MLNNTSQASNDVSESLRAKLGLDEHGDEAIEFWADVRRLRRELLLGGKVRILGLIHLKVLIGEATPYEAVKTISSVLGIDDWDALLELVDDYEGPDPQRHLWHKDSSGAYFTHG